MTDTWVQLAEIVVVTTVFLGAGALPLLTLGLRWPAALAASPLVTVSACACWAIVAGQFGLPAGFAPTLVVIAVLALIGWPIGRRLARPQAVPVSTVAVGVGLVAGAALAVAALVRGWHTADAISQTFDAVFHYNGVRFALDGNWSSLVMGTLASPAVKQSFYPAAWHDLVASVIQVTGADIFLAVNAMTVVIVAVIFPAGSVLLVRQIVGPRTDALVAAAVVSAGFVAFPIGTVTFGVLWPNSLGVAMVPAMLAAAVAVAGRARDDVIGRGRGALILLAGLPGLALAHPNAVVSLVVLVTPLVASVAFVALRRSVSNRHAGGAATVIASLVIVVGLAAAVAIGVHRISSLNFVFSFNWPAYETVSQAAGEVLTWGMNKSPASWIMTGLVVAGMVTTARDARIRWLLWAHLIGGALYILAAATENQFTALVTSPWYNDAFRLAARMPLTGVPLAVLGLVTLADWARDAIPAEGGWARLRRPVFAVALVVVVALSGLMYLKPRTDRVALYYPTGPTYAISPLLSTTERDAYRELAQSLPDNALVAGNPWDGSALLYAVGDRHVVFPHLEGTWGPQRVSIAYGLNRMMSDPKVCQAVKDLGITHALYSGQWLWPTGGTGKDYKGMFDLDKAPGFTPVKQVGGVVLYRLEPCG